MIIFDNLLKSGYSFNAYENLQKYRYILFNSILLVASLFSLLIAFLSTMNLVPMHHIHTIILYLYALTNLLLSIILRIKRDFFFIVFNILMITSLITYISATIFVIEDEFRLIWYFLFIFISYMIGGKTYGVVSTLTIIFLVITIHINLDINFSNHAIFTFSNSLIIFSIVVYFYTIKIENDQIELNNLNQKLIQRVEQEVLQNTSLKNIIIKLGESSKEINQYQKYTNAYATLISSLSTIYLRSKYLTKILIQNENFNLKLEHTKFLFFCTANAIKLEHTWSTLFNSILDALNDKGENEISHNYIIINITTDTNSILISITSNISQIKNFDLIKSLLSENNADIEHIDIKDELRYNIKLQKPIK